MSNSTRRAAATVIAAALAVSTMTGAGTAGAKVGDQPSDIYPRASGADRYATSAEIAGLIASSPSVNPVRTVIVASGEEPGQGADALAANFLGGVLSRRDGEPVPVLLTRRDELPASTRQALQSIVDIAEANNGETVFAYVVGGTDAVSGKVLGEVTSTLGHGMSVSRTSGDDRYATAAAVVEQAVGIAGSDPDEGVTTTFPDAYLAGGTNSADALSAAPASYAGGIPLLLTQTDIVDDRLITQLLTLGGRGVEKVTVLGGVDAVGPAVEGALRDAGFRVERLGGPDRFATNRLINDDARARDIYQTPSAPLLVNGLSFSDALSAAPLAAEGGAPYGQVGAAYESRQPVLLTSPFELSRATAGYISDNAARIDGVFPIGGTAALPEQRVVDAQLLLTD